MLIIILHKLTKYKNKKAVLIISSWIADKLPDYKRLYEFFDDIIVINANIEFKDEDSYRQNAVKFFENLFSEKPYKINNFEDVIVGGAHYSIGSYSIEKKVKFDFLEEAAGILSNPEVLENIENNFSVEKTKYNKKCGLYDGTNSLIKSRICNLNAQKKEFNAINTEHFDIIDNMSKLNSEEREKVIKIFSNVSKIDIPEDATLVLTQHFTNLQLLSFDEQVLIYQIFIDYFFDNQNLVFKPHPDDLMYYGLLFPGCNVIRDKFPSEFLPFIFTKKPRQVATISSTAIENLYGHFDTCFSLNTQYERNFKFTHRYYFALKVLQKLQAKMISVIGVNTLLLKRLSETDDCLFNELQLVELTKPEPAKVLIVDKFNPELNDSLFDVINVSGDDDIILFINSNQDFCFYDINQKHLWNDIIPICIKKKIIKREEFYADDSEEVIYLYCRNKEIRRMVEQMQFDKNLVNTGLDMSIEPLTPEQQRIKILEGILEATEKRLLYYIEAYEKLKTEK